MLKAHLPLLSGAIGTMIVVAAFFQGIDTEQSRRPFFLAWALLITFQIGFWIISLQVLWGAAKQLKKLGNAPKRNIFQLTLPAAAIFFFVAIQFLAIRWLFPSDIKLPFEDFAVNFWIFSGFGFLLAFLWIMVIWIIGYKIQDSLLEVAVSQANYDSYIDLQKLLDQSILVLGTIVGLATLSAGALRELQIAIDPKVASYYPSALVLAYGGYLTVVLALVVVPTYASLLNLGSKLRDKKIPPPRFDSYSWNSVYEERKRFDEVFQLSLNSSRNLKSGVAVLLPLIGSVVSVLVT